MGHLRGQDRQCARLQMTGDPQIQLDLPSGQPLGRRGLQCRQLDVVVGRSRCSIEREPLRQDHTICTAVAPDDVFTVRT